MDFDECSLNPCGEKMTCINMGNSYKCQCSEAGCELDIAYENDNFVMIEVDENDDLSTQKTDTESPNYYYDDA